jgi:hypothetical protein
MHAKLSMTGRGLCLQQQQQLHVRRTMLRHAPHATPAHCSAAPAGSAPVQQQPAANPANLLTREQPSGRSRSRSSSSSSTAAAPPATAAAMPAMMPRSSSFARGQAWTRSLLLPADGIMTSALMNKIVGQVRLGEWQGVGAAKGLGWSRVGRCTASGQESKGGLGSLPCTMLYCAFPFHHPGPSPRHLTLTPSPRLHNPSAPGPVAGALRP